MSVSTLREYVSVRAPVAGSTRERERAEWSARRWTTASAAGPAAWSDQETWLSGTATFRSTTLPASQETRRCRQPPSISAVITSVRPTTRWSW